MAVSGTREVLLRGHFHERTIPTRRFFLKAWDGRMTIPSGVRPAALRAPMTLSSCRGETPIPTFKCPARRRNIRRTRVWPSLHRASHRNSIYVCSTGGVMLAQIGSASVSGVESHAVSVEVNISVGLSSFVVVGLPHGAVREGRERVMAALANARHPVPQRGSTRVVQIRAVPSSHVSAPVTYLTSRERGRRPERHAHARVKKDLGAGRFGVFRPSG
jgi:hypothetical protein